MAQHCGLTDSDIFIVIHETPFPIVFAPYPNTLLHLVHVMPNVTCPAPDFEIGTSKSIERLWLANDPESMLVY